MTKSSRLKCRQFVAVAAIFCALTVLSFAPIVLSDLPPRVALTSPARAQTPAVPPAIAPGWRKLELKVTLGRNPTDAKKGWFGIYIDLSETLASQIGPELPKGFYIISAHGGAAAAGIRVGDVITRIAGQAVRNLRQHLALVGRLPPDIEINVEVWRYGGGRDDLKRSLEARTKANDRNAVRALARLARHVPAPPASQAEPSPQPLAPVPPQIAAASPEPPAQPLPPSVPGPQTPARLTTSEWYKVEIPVTLKASGPNNPRGSLGVNILDDDTFSALLSPDLPRGFFVTSDDEGSAAGGMIRRGDIITMIDGQAPRSGAHVRSLITRHTAGTEVKIEYWRYSRGFPLLRQSIFQRSRERDATATYLYGVMIGVAAIENPDHVRAFETFTRAAELGSHHAMSAVANAIANGRGTERNLPEAARWFRRAVSAGSIPAMYSLANLLASGRAGPANPAESFRLMVRAATVGHAFANYVLAKYYDIGYGAQKNPDAAARHMIEAMRNGDTAMLVRFSSEISGTRSQEFYTHLQLRLRESGVYQGPIDGKINPQMMGAFARLHMETTLPVSDPPMSPSSPFYERPQVSDPPMSPSSPFYEPPQVSAPPSSRPRNQRPPVSDPPMSPSSPFYEPPQVSDPPMSPSSPFYEPPQVSAPPSSRPRNQRPPVSDPPQSPSSPFYEPPEMDDPTSPFYEPQDEKPEPLGPRTRTRTKGVDPRTKGVYPQPRGVYPKTVHRPPAVTHGTRLSAMARHTPRTVVRQPAITRIVPRTVMRQPAIARPAPRTVMRQPAIVRQPPPRIQVNCKMSSANCRRR